MTIIGAHLVVYGILKGGASKGRGSPIFPRVVRIWTFGRLAALRNSQWILLDPFGTFEKSMIFLFLRNRCCICDLNFPEGYAFCTEKLMGFWKTTFSGLFSLWGHEG